MTATSEISANNNSRNPNNWHWVERNCFPWAKKYLEKNLLLSTSENGVAVSIDGVEMVKGDVDLNIRKGKLKYVYDLNLELKWIGADQDSNIAKGKIVMPECTVNEEPNEWEFIITCEEENVVKKKIKNVAERKLKEELGVLFAKFAKDLLNECGNDVLQSTNVPAVGNNNNNNNSNDDSNSKSSSSLNLSVPEKEKRKEEDPKKKSNGCTIEYSTEFKCSDEDLFLALMDPQRVRIWTSSGDVIVSTEVGSQYRIFNGCISGRTISCVPGKRVELEWRKKEWPEDHYSTVLMELEQGVNSTTLRLKQTNVPTNERDHIANEWEKQYFNRIKHIFGYVI
jgi:activator of HSP90 ATPase